MWSTIGWGSGALVLMLIGETKHLPFRVPGLLILIVVSILDMFIITFWRNKDDFVMLTGDAIAKTKEVTETATNGSDPASSPTAKKTNNTNRDTLPNWIVKVSCQLIS